MPAALDELPVAAATLIAAQLDVDLSSIAPARLNVERGARAEHLAHAMAISAFRPCGDEDLDNCDRRLATARWATTGRWP